MHAHHDTALSYRGVVIILRIFRKRPWPNAHFLLQQARGPIYKCLTIILRLSYYNAKVTIDLRRSSNLQNIEERKTSLALDPLDPLTRFQLSSACFLGSGSVLSVDSNQNVESKTKNVGSPRLKNDERKIAFLLQEIRKIIKTVATI